MPQDFAYYLFVGDLPEVRAQIRRLESAYRAVGNIPAASAVAAAYDKHAAGLIGLALDISAEGTELLRAHERNSRVRPDSQGGGGPRLGDALFAESLSFEGLPGSVGVANESILDREVPWWETNEVGSSARVGAKLYGTFEPGGWLPDPAQSRQHPIFEPRSKSEGGGSMVIKNPIPARRFIETAIPEIRTLWHDRFDALKSELVTEVAAAELV